MVAALCALDEILLGAANGVILIDRSLHLHTVGTADMASALTVPAKLTPMWTESKSQ
jgi:hypothetical protein